MDSHNLFFGMMNIGCGFVFILIGLPLAFRKVPMNSLYGFRIPKAFTSNTLWYEINCYGGRQLVRWSIFLILIGILYFIFPIQTGQDTFLSIFLAVAPILVCVAATVFKTVLYARQL